MKNLGNSMAFMVHLRAARSPSGADIVPDFLGATIIFRLLPGEQREVSATYPASALAGDTAVLEVEGFNVTRQTVESETASGGAH